MFWKKKIKPILIIKKNSGIEVIDKGSYLIISSDAPESIRVITGVDIKK